MLGNRWPASFTSTLITLNQNAPTAMCRTPVVIRIIWVREIELTE
jgi:hypothetical protein